MPSSTRIAASCWRLADIDDGMVAAMTRIPPAQVAARREQIAAEHADASWVAATLDALPAPTLAVLSLLVARGGLANEDEIVRAAHDDFGLTDHDFQLAAVPAVAKLLVVPLRSRGDRVMLSLVAPSAHLVAPLVADLDLHALPAAGFVAEASPVRNSRTFLAVCVASRHADVKLTAEGRPHRTAVKRLAKQVGIDEATLEAMLVIGLELGLLNLEGEVLRPDLEALADAATGRHARDPAIAAIRARLEQGPISAAAIARSLHRERSTPASVGVLAYLPGFELGAVHGVAVVARVAIDGDAHGHVTPSFEVFLPPESRLLDIVHVGACCEWVRLDRAIVGRITKPSIAHAVAGGSTAGQILDALAAASRHPIPQNVEAAIRDWAGSVVAATIATGHVIVVDPSASTRVGAALAELGARELAPGVFVVNDDDGVREITVALARAGVLARATSAVRPAPRPPVPDELLVVPPGAARLRARVAAWRRGEPFEGTRDDYLEKQRSVPPVRPAASGGDDVARALARWAADRRCDLEMDDTQGSGILSVLSMLPAGEAANILDRSRDLDGLMHALARVVKKLGWGKPRPPTRGQTRKASVPRPRRPALMWQTDDLLERLQRAARNAETLALQVGSGVRYVEISRTLRRGTIWMVLGADLAGGEDVALRIDEIEAIAALPDDFEIDPDENDDVDDDVIEHKPWRPAPGQPPPAGHLPCPCGSGARYRQCCRNAMTT